MSLRQGDILKDTRSGEQRFRIASLLSEGRSFFVATGEDTHLEDMKVTLKAIRYEDESRDPTSDEIQERSRALEIELQALTVETSLLPEPIDFIHVDDGNGPEPVLVLEFIHGKTLRQEVERTNGKGMDPRRALAITHELALGLKALHKAGFAFRDLNPDHVIVGLDDNIHLVGTGNIAPISKRPVVSKTGVSDRYSAPEIRHERSGKFIRPQADIYSLGALLSFMLTGVDPCDRIESPLEPEAYKKLTDLNEGYALLVARCIQSMAKWRFKSIDAMLPLLTPQTLPSRSTRGFDKVELQKPFDLNLDRTAQNRAARSKISSGPLISVPRDTDNDGQDAPERPPRRKKRRKKKRPADPKDGAIVKKDKSGPPAKQPFWKGCFPWLSFSILLLTSALIALISVFYNAH